MPENWARPTKGRTIRKRRQRALKKAERRTKESKAVVVEAENSRDKNNAKTLRAGQPLKGWWVNILLTIILRPMVCMEIAGAAIPSWLVWLYLQPYIPGTKEWEAANSQLIKDLQKGVKILGKAPRRKAGTSSTDQRSEDSEDVGSTTDPQTKEAGKESGQAAEISESQEEKVECTRNKPRMVGTTRRNCARGREGAKRKDRKGQVKVDEKPPLNLAPKVTRMITDPMQCRECYLHFNHSTKPRTISYRRCRRSKVDFHMRKRYVMKTVQPDQANGRNGGRRIMKERGAAKSISHRQQRRRTKTVKMHDGTEGIVVPVNSKRVRGPGETDNENPGSEMTDDTTSCLANTETKVQEEIAETNSLRSDSHDAAHGGSDNRISPSNNEHPAVVDERAKGNEEVSNLEKHDAAHGGSANRNSNKDSAQKKTTMGDRIRTIWRILEPTKWVANHISNIIKETCGVRTERRITRELEEGVQLQRKELKEAEEAETRKNEGGLGLQDSAGILKRVETAKDNLQKAIGKQKTRNLPLVGGSRHSKGTGKGGKSPAGVNGGKGGSKGGGKGRVDKGYASGLNDEHEERATGSRNLGTRREVSRRRE